ncbi:MAG: response regulator [Chloroflexota bacterium]|nr:MAG: response regulator [Chloroflexota bacterium]
MAKIVVVDDDPLGRRYVSDLLRSFRHVVHEASDGQEGLDLVMHERPDLVLTDLLMPRLDGYELAHQIRQDPAMSQLPIIFYSATYQEREGRELAAEPGAHVLVKPGEPQVILNTVERVLRWSSRLRGTVRPAAPRAGALDARNLADVGAKLASKVQELQVVDWRLDALLSLSAAMAGLPDPESVASRMCSGARDIIPSRRAGIVIAANDDDHAELYVTSGLTDDELAILPAHPALDGIVGQVIRSGNPARASTAGRRGGKARLVQLPDGHPPVASFLVVPVPFRSLRGALYLADRLGGDAFGAGDQRVAVALAAQLASTFESHRLLVDLRATVANLERSRRALDSSEDQFRRVLDSSPNSIIGVDRGGLITFANPQVAASFGYALEELVGQSVGVLVPDRIGSHAAHVATFLDSPIARPLGIGLELAARRRDGSEFPVEISLAPVASPDGGSMTFATIVDISARKRFEAQMVQAQKMESIGMLAGGVAHDFNNLLTAISGFAELLAMDTPEGDPRREYVDGISRATSRAAGLTRQLLAFGRRQVLNPAPVDLGSLVRDMEPMLRRLAGEDIVFAFEFDADTPPALFDASRLEQVLVNLVVNARDAIAAAGHIVIRISSAELDESYGPDHGADVPAGTYVILTVADDGAGMDQATRSRIFEPFFTTKEAGTGLGLSSVYGIVKQSGGFIWVYSELGKGTTFKLYLPRATAVPTLEPEAPAAVAPQASGTVLLVEDEPAVLGVIARMLGHAGFHVLAAETPEAALEIARTQPGPIDILLADVVMPEMTGPELAKALTGIRDLRVLFMSGYAWAALGRRGVLDDDAQVIEKPFSANELVARVAAIAATPALATSPVRIGRPRGS